MNTVPNCPQCDSEYVYEDRKMLICPSCNHEWALGAENKNTEAEGIVRDAYGNELRDGDTITVIKTLKVKGSSAVVKIGTKVKNIRVVVGVGGHDIDCRIDGIGSMQLKSEFVKKV
jgi:protein PhnA